MNIEQIEEQIRQQDAKQLETLWQRADRVRRESVGDAVHLRGLVEFSNYCRRTCWYCGLNAANQDVQRYRMSMEEILDCARQAVDYGYGTLVLQSGEDDQITDQWMADCIRQIKHKTPLAVTLSLGERTNEEFELWRHAGADRYLIRFETSNRKLYEKIHPQRNGKPSDRFAILQTLRQLGYEIGSGVMIGLPGQSYTDLARDIQLFAELQLDMIGVGPFITHPDSILAGETIDIDDPDQVPNTELMTYKVLALARLVCPQANIPSTTALATLNLQQGRELGLSRGANVIMPNLTPIQYREHYEIYPGKACLRETAEQCHHCVRRRIESIGRTVSTGRGDSLNYLNRKNSPVLQKRK